MSAYRRSVEEHLAEILTRTRTTDTEELAVGDAAGRVLRHPVVAAADIPVFDNSAMDGFAVRFDDVRTATEDGPARVRVVADLPAGTALDPALGPGEAARIMTGSPVPADADAIVPFEDTAGGLADSLDEVAVLRAPKGRGAHIRRRAGDVAVGDRVAPDGVVLGPLQLGAIAAAGVARVRVAVRPRVAVISTGTELVEPGSPLRRGQIPESNGPLLAALVRAAGAEVVLQRVASDDEDAFRSALDAAADAGAEVVVTSGGVSAGAFEVVRQTLEGAGREDAEPGTGIEFSTVAMQPGKPQAFGVLPGGALFLGLPGNPVSVAVSFETFVRPALLRMLGARDLHRPRIRIPAAAAWTPPRGRRQYLPAAIDRTDPGRWTVRPATAGGSGSHLAGGLAQAEAYAIVAADVTDVAVGDPVDVMLVT